MASSTDAVTAGIAADAVTRWLLDNVDGVTAPFAFELIAGGRSNLTYAATDAAGRRMVLRRPPLSHVLATAHDVGREFRIISALHGTAVPVAPPLGHCADTEVNGAPFYVMEFVDGAIVKDAAAAAGLDDAARGRARESVVDTLAAIHAIDPDDVGLGDLGKKDDYVGRQLRRWKKQVEAVERRPAEIDAAHDRLAADVPAPQGVDIAHGDYRLDNCMTAADGTIAAVLDWELCTLGDGLADLGMLLVSWTEPGDRSYTPWPDAATKLPGFGSRAEVIERYAKVSGRDVDRVDFYRALALWRLACISVGVTARYMQGAMGDQPDVDLDARQEGPARLAQAAIDALDGR
jgi:aminoglycoside phosphotransferase (APT) family kinase protein